MIAAERVDSLRNLGMLYVVYFRPYGNAHIRPLAVSVRRAAPVRFRSQAALRCHVRFVVTPNVAGSWPSEREERELSEAQILSFRWRFARTARPAAGKPHPYLWRGSTSRSQHRILCKPQGLPASLAGTSTPPIDSQVIRTFISPNLSHAHAPICRPSAPPDDLPTSGIRSSNRHRRIFVIRQQETGLGLYAAVTQHRLSLESSPKF